MNNHGRLSKQAATIITVLCLSLAGQGCGFNKYNSIELDTDSVLGSSEEIDALQAYLPDIKKKYIFKKHEVYRCSEDPIVNDRKEQLVSIDLFEMDLRSALGELSVQIEFPILIDENVSSIISATLDNVPLITALDTLLAASDYSYRFEKNYLLVGTSEPDTASFARLAQTCRYKPRHMASNELNSILSEQQQQFVRVPEGNEILSIHAPSAIQEQILRSLELHDEELGQVVLELSIIEVSRDAMQVLGISWDRPLSVTYDILRRPILLRSMRALQKQGKASVKTMPSIVSKDGHEAHFESKHTTWLPYSIRKGYSTVQHQEISYGIELKIIPNIAVDGRITLEILDASVSDLVITEDDEHLLMSHRISNTVDVKDGDYLVLGGLLQKKQSTHKEGLPFISNFNPLNLFFSQSETKEYETEILIMIRPRII